MIISPDTKRGQRIPPGQSQTVKWPVLDASGTPPVDMSKWRLEVFGLVEREVSLTWDEFMALPRVEVFSDFHCVTRWSRLDNTWTGVSVATLMELAGGVKPEAQFVSAHGYDYGWTTNLPLADFLSEDALVATHHDGVALTPEHGGPARLVVPQLYAWKSAKWVGAIELLAEDKPGFWERNGYHNHGDPWKEERFGY
jgi:DMSO/TMAO reductase YedYZ molybdopterin-dependent catalytic subunit